MKKLTYTFSLVILSVTLTFAQDALDSIFTNTEVLAVNIKEVTEEAVKFTYPGEEIQNSLNLNSVSKIVFRSGRVQNFSESRSYKQVKNGLDWEYVTVIQTENEVKGLHQLDQVNAKAKAATGWGSVGKMENKAMRKLLIETAMNGGNVVYLTQQNSSTRTQRSTSSSVVGGVAYGNIIPDYTAFTKITEGKDGFKYIENHSLGVNSDDMKVSAQNGELVKFDKVERAGSMIYVYAKFPKIDTDKFRVSYFDNDQIILVYRTKKHIVNLILML